MPLMRLSTEGIRDDGRNLWDKLPNETPKAFDAFEAYRTLDPDDRSILAVARMIGRTTTKMGPKGDRKETAHKRLFTWSRDNHWISRAAAWDDHMAELARVEEERQLKYDVAQACKHKREIRRRAYRAFIKLDEIIDNRLNGPGKLTPKEIRELALARERAGIMARDSFLGLPNDDGSDDGDIAPDLAAEITALMAKHALRKMARPTETVECRMIDGG